ncbi:aminotransferase-like domain-containing protein, partial [Bacillus mobilis]
MLDINWRPDRNNPTRLNIQIVNFIKDKIATGEWPVGFKLPSQRTLSEIFSVNRSTVVSALEELAAEGLINGNAGGGTKVINNTWTLMSINHSHNWLPYISSGLHQTNQKIMQQINQAEFQPDIIRMGSCEPSPELIPNKMIQGVLKKLSNSMGSLGYEEPKGNIHLRREVCTYLKTIGIEADPSSVLITSGVLQALQLISLGLLQTNSVVYVEKPSYLYSLRTFQSLGMQLSGIKLDEEGIEIKELIDRHRRRKGAMLFTIPTFQNPTGSVMSLERRKTLVDACDRERLPIIEDDVYRELWFDEKPPQPIKAFDNNGLVLYIGGISKNFSPGLRIGWIVGSEKVIERLADIKMQTDYGTSSLSQNVITELFSSGLYYQHNDIMRKNVKLRRDVALEALKKYFTSIGTWNIPRGGYFIWLKLNKSISMY